MRRWALAVALAVAPAGAQGPADPDNPTCPSAPGWGSADAMRFSLETRDGRRVLVGEGTVDRATPDNLAAALGAHGTIDEIWLRSRGGNAAAGNAAGRLIRKAGVPTRIPAGWACFSACNFVFMGGPIRFVDAGGLFIVHMFTHLGDAAAVKAELKKGDDDALAMVGDIEQGSALLASDDNDFLIRMGVSRKLLTEVMYRQRAVAGGDDRSTRRCLTQAELVKYTVKNAE